MDVPELARAFQSFLEAVNVLASDGQGAQLRASLEAHLGQDPLALPVISDRYAPFEHVNVQVALEAWLDHTPNPTVGLEVLATDAAYGERIVAGVRRLSVERSVFRNQVISFAAGPFGEQTAGPIAFHPRPQLAREDVILPESTFAAVEEHVFGIAAHRERLLESGQHLKRGLLLHGPPGTGKTLTTRYLSSRLTDHTVVAAASARRARGRGPDRR